MPPPRRCFAVAIENSPGVSILEESEELGSEGSTTGVDGGRGPGDGNRAEEAADSEVVAIVEDRTIVEESCWVSSIASPISL